LLFVEMSMQAGVDKINERNLYKDKVAHGQEVAARIWTDACMVQVEAHKEEAVVRCEGYRMVEVAVIKVGEEEAERAAPRVQHRPRRRDDARNRQPYGAFAV
jgi:hypothetical protein